MPVAARQHPQHQPLGPAKFTCVFAVQAAWRWLACYEVWYETGRVAAAGGEVRGCSRVFAAEYDRESALGFLILLLVLLTPIAWFASEFQDRRWPRLCLGTAAILLSFGVAYVGASLQILQDNVWFGNASKLLIDASIQEMEAGNQEQVLTAWKHLQKKYSPTYENRARFDYLVDETVVEMRTGQEKEP